MTETENAQQLAQAFCRAAVRAGWPYISLKAVEDALLAARDDATCRGILYEWLRRLEEAAP